MEVAMTQDSIPQIRHTPLAPALHKRYWLFVWDEYEPRGAMHDFDSAFDTIEEAEGSFQARTDRYRLGYDIYDSQTGEML
jgi:hypothetical protein